ALSIRGSSLAHNPLFSHHLVPCREPSSTKVKPWVPNSNQETVFDIKFTSLVPCQFVGVHWPTILYSPHHLVPCREPCLHQGQAMGPQFKPRDCLRHQNLYDL
ncbi:hypothetical protein CFP56_026769, partial [Quercus suber]